MTCGVRHWLGVVAVVSAAGCGVGSKAPKLPEPVPVSGTVTYGDAPLANAVILFNPTGTTEGKGASGVTDASGKYELETPWANGKMKKGAIPGTYKVTFSRMVKPDGSLWKPDNDSGGPMTAGAKEELPPEYSINSKMTTEVKAGGPPLDFKLEKKAGK